MTKKKKRKILNLKNRRKPDLVKRRISLIKLIPARFVIRNLNQKR
jgi:hypothetical protein